MKLFCQRVLSSPRGLTAIELVIYIGMTYFIITWVAYFARMPSRMATVDQKRQATVTTVAATDAFVSDLREATPSSFDWTSIPTAPPDAATNLISFKKDVYDLANPANPPQTTNLTYKLQAGSSGLKDLVRSVTDPFGITTNTTLLRNLDASTTSQYFVQQDTAAYHVITVSLSYHYSPNVAPVRVVRRLAIQG